MKCTCAEHTCDTSRVTFESGLDHIGLQNPEGGGGGGLPYEKYGGCLSVVLKRSPKRYQDPRAAEN